MHWHAHALTLEIFLELPTSTFYLFLSSTNTWTSRWSHLPNSQNIQYSSSHIVFLITQLNEILNSGDEVTQTIVLYFYRLIKKGREKNMMLLEKILSRVSRNDPIWCKQRDQRTKRLRIQPSTWLACVMYGQNKDIRC